MDLHSCRIIGFDVSLLPALCFGRVRAMAPQFIHGLSGDDLPSLELGTCPISRSKYSNSKPLTISNAWATDDRPREARALGRFLV